jgi:ABC-type polysaccharide/polyol phosphate export permease
MKITWIDYILAIDIFYLFYKCKMHMHDNENPPYLALGIIVVAIFHPVTELCVSNVSQMV